MDQSNRIVFELVRAISEIAPERENGDNDMILERFKEYWRLIWRKSLDELIFGNQAKHKQPVGIPWLNVHRLFDSHWWRRPGPGLYLSSKEGTGPGRRRIG